MTTTADKNGIFAVFDVGSNSVRALVRSEEKTYFQGLETTRLGEKLDEKKELTPVAVERTVKGIEKLLAEVKKYDPQRIFAFATEAVRSAKNGSEFVGEVKKRTSLTIEIIDGEEEGEIGLSGAVGAGDGGIIDIGGASAEIAVRKGGKTVYCHSLPLGAVRLKDICGEDEGKLCELIDKSSPMLCLTTYEKDLADIQVGSPVQFRVNGMGTQTFHGIVISIGQKVDETNRSLEVYASIKEENVQFRPGMYVTAHIQKQ